MSVPILTLFHSHLCFCFCTTHLNVHKYFVFKVLVWIYGGGFAIGGEAYFDLSALVSLHNVVVVVPNYRLNVFGFLSLGQNTDYPGNVGLLDQTMAMK